MEIKYSILICTIARDLELLKRCIMSACELCSKNYEIVIVHQGKNPIDWKLVDVINPIRTKYFFLNELGLSNARNYGISRCEGEYIIFIDDDAYFHKDFLKHLECIVRENEACGITGIVLNEDTNKPIGRCIKSKPLRSLSWKDYNQWMSSVTVIKKSAIILAGLYDTNFGVGGGKYGGSEDTDLFFRLLHKQCALFASNQLFVYHPGSKKLSSARNREKFLKGFHYGIGRTAVFRKGAAYSSRRMFFYFAWLNSIGLAIAGCAHALLRLEVDQFIMDLGSILGRTLGFLVYEEFKN